MKTLARTFLPVLALLIATPARADGPVSGMDLASASVTRSPHKKLASGRTLTIMGLVHLAVGGGLGLYDYAASRKCAQTQGCLNEMGSLPFIVSESLLVSSGAIFVSAGLPMWAIGARDARRVDLGVSAQGLRIRF